MKLAVCIPTHHGRAETLRELLDSLLRQQHLLQSGQVQICISDNASQDGTAELVAAYQRSSRIPIRYFRFATDMRGVRNFINVVEMADAEYCWLMGSDDVVVDGSLERVLQALAEHSGVRGMTVNKLNFDRSLQSLVGPDHEIALPANAFQSRLFQSFEEILDNLGIAFGYMSAHVFRRDSWRQVIETYGADYLCTLRHFPHTFIYSHIAREHGSWAWLSDYLVIQRLDNFCVVEESGNRMSRYATEVSEDLARVWALLLPPRSAPLQALMRRIFIIYWNPWLVLKYRGEPEMSPTEERAMLRQCKAWFGAVPLFWTTSWPVFVLPAAWIKPLRQRIERLDRMSRSHPLARRARSWGRSMAHGMLRVLGIESGSPRPANAARAVADRYLASASNGAERDISSNESAQRTEHMR